MWIYRDLSAAFDAYSGLEAAAILGPRQVGKTSFLTRLQSEEGAFVPLDDLQLRSLARSDPALLLDGRPIPIVIDEFQYAPELLSEIKLRIDARRRRRLSSNTESAPLLFFLSGSNQIEVDTSLRETLAGRISLFSLHGLSVHELRAIREQFSVAEIIFRGGFPELYTRRSLDPVDYLNGYVSTFVEKDIARSAGVAKLNEFMTVTKLLSARVGNLVDFSSLSRDAGVASKTVGEWVAILERARIVFLLPPYSSNLNSRLIKTPKVYFIDTGLASRLQGHQSASSILGTPHSGALFENLVVAEVVKTRDHFRRSWSVSFWRTKDQDEVDLVIETGSKRLFLECKLAIQSATAIQFSNGLRKHFPGPLTGLVVTLGGETRPLNGECIQVPIANLAEWLLQNV